MKLLKLKSVVGSEMKLLTWPKVFNALKFESEQKKRVKWQKKRSNKLKVRQPNKTINYSNKFLIELHFFFKSCEKTKKK